MIQGKFLWEQGNKSQVFNVSTKPAGWCGDQVLSGYWGAAGKALGVWKWIAGCDSLQKGEA